jgi:antitoxin component of MazEF toxin-antitoxin module
VVELTVEADRLVVRARDAEPTLEELLAGITPENLPESFDVRPVGEEAL